LHRLLLITIFSVAVSFNKEVTLRIPLQPGEKPEDIAVVTFDADRISVQDLKRWMLLHERAYYDTPLFGFYPEPKPSDIPKLKEDIKKTEQIVSELDASHFPAELTDVVRYLKDLQSFWLWLSQQELAFLESGKLPPAKYGRLDLEVCQLPSSADRPPASSQIFISWHTCVNHEMAQQVGPYPKEKWKAFLNSRGIQERLESTVD
jgi:hypothetical protein